MSDPRRLKLPAWALLVIGKHDKWTCHICDQGYIQSEQWEIDHDQSIAKGGTNHLSNLRLAHRTCNRDKASA